MNTTTTPLRRVGIATLTLIALVGACLVAAIMQPATAAASSVGRHDPIGKVRSIDAVKGGAVISGWAADPDSLHANLTVVAVLDGHGVLFARTTVTDAAVTKKYATSSTPGYRLTVPLPAGRHTLCLVGRDIGAGEHRVFKCVATPLGTRLTASQTEARSPNGDLFHAKARGHTYRITGWASDPDLYSRRSKVVLYLDGSSAETVMTSTYRGSRPAAAGAKSAFDISVPISAGAHLGCVWVVNVGLGSNAFLGCAARDTRGQGPSSSTTPKLNKKVLAEAKKHIGQPYVWGAVGPKKFDCSGLVLYSYKKNGFTTPRISEDQYAAARLIPASHALPGDPVFYHDSEGDVYHVGIYVSPGKTVAAIDEDQGVDWQLIWDPSSTTYGSFTHT